jgi:hypothetical protein
MKRIALGVLVAALALAGMARSVDAEGVRLRFTKLRVLNYTDQPVGVYLLRGTPLYTEDGKIQDILPDSMGSILARRAKPVRRPVPDPLDNRPRRTTFPRALMLMDYRGEGVSEGWYVVGVDLDLDGVPDLVGDTLSYSPWIDTSTKWRGVEAEVLPNLGNPALLLHLIP